MSENPTKSNTYHFLVVNIKDLYELLDVTRTADIEEIKDAYKKKASELHPDKNPDCTDCQEKFGQVSTAHTVLTDPEAREYYDNVQTRYF